MFKIYRTEHNRLPDYPMGVTYPWDYDHAAYALVDIKSILVTIANLSDYYHDLKFVFFRFNLWSSITENFECNIKRK